MLFLTNDLSPIVYESDGDWKLKYDITCFQLFYTKLAFLFRLYLCFFRKQCWKVLKSMLDCRPLRPAVISCLSSLVNKLEIIIMKKKKSVKIYLKLNVGLSLIMTQVISNFKMILGLWLVHSFTFFEKGLKSLITSLGNFNRGRGL